MKRKIISILMAAALLTALLPITAFSAKAEVSDMIAFMNKMGFISEGEISSDKEEQPITRMDFAMFTARILGVSEDGESDNNYFYDIPDDHWGKFSINSLVERGILTTADRNFRPDDTITKSEAARIAVTCIGRNGEAEIRGGYPNGYLSVAAEDRLFDNSGAGDKLTYRSAAVLLYNMMNADIVEMKLVGKGMEYSKNGETLLSLYHDIYKGEGRLDAVSGVAVDENEAKSENDAVIDGEHYSADEWYYDYLGMNIDYFYKEENGDKSLVYVFQKTDVKNEIIRINSDDYIGFEDGAVKYYTGENSEKSKNARIYSGAVVIRNGENVSSDLTSAFRDFYGYMRIINTGKYNGADVVIIEDYKNVAVGKINTDDKVIYNKYNAYESFDLSDEDGEVVKYFNPDGGETDFSAISADNVIDVAAASDRSFIIVKVNNETIIGSIGAKGTDEDGDGYLVIDGTRYTAEKSFYEKFADVFNIGDKGTFRTDIFGKIAYFSIEKGDSMIFAYLINAYIDSEIDSEDIGSERVIMKLFTEDGEIVKAACAEKVKIDARPYKNNEEILEVFTPDETIVPQLIRFKYDKDGCIKTIDTKARRSEEGKYSLSLCQNEKNIYHHWTGLIGQNAYVPSSVKVMVIPSEGTEKTADSSAFMIKNRGYIPSGRSSRIDLYQLDPESLDIDMVIYYENQSDSIDTYSSIYVVEDVSEALNADEEAALCLTLDKDGSNVNYIISKTYTPDGASKPDPYKIEAGDIIRIATDYKNEISNMELVFDYSKAKEGGNFGFFDNSMKSNYRIVNGVVPGNFFDGFKMSYGYVSRTSGKTLQWGYAKPGDCDETYNVTIDSSSVKILIFDEKNKQDKARRGTIDDIVGFYQSAGDFSKIVALSRSAVISQMIVYR